MTQQFVQCPGCGRWTDSGFRDSLCATCAKSPDPAELRNLTPDEQESYQRAVRAISHPVRQVVDVSTTPGTVASLPGEWTTKAAGYSDRGPYARGLRDALTKCAAELERRLQAERAVPADAVRAVEEIRNLALRGSKTGRSDYGVMVSLAELERFLSALGHLPPREGNDDSMIQHPIALTPEEADWLLHHSVHDCLQLHQTAMQRLDAGADEIKEEQNQVEFLTNLRDKLAHVVALSEGGEGSDGK